MVELARMTSTTIPTAAGRNSAAVKATSTRTGLRYSQMAYCYRHPDRETGLSCSECDRPICYECMTPAPVGLRCPEHSGKPQGIQKITKSVERVATGNRSYRVNAVTMA